MYAEIEYYFFDFFMNISDAIILYLLECKTTRIKDNTPQKNMSAKRKYIYPRNKTYAKKKYSTIDTLNL
jgi:hypothetical protein